MFAKIRINKNIHGSFYYNERKLKVGEAVCLYAGNFIKDAEQLSQKDKIYHFSRLTSLHEKYKTNCFHTSLNFHPLDKLSPDDMCNIARDYMQQMKMGQQPYLVYRHDDAAHPHIHLLSTIVRNDGSLISFSRKDFYQSQNIAKQFEMTYSLIPRRSKRSKKLDYPFDSSGQVQKIKYGRTPTLPAISAVLDKVIVQYKYSSLPEFNAILSLYNVEACQGKEGSRTQKHHGLIYRTLDDKAKPIGAHIKASVFDSKPTLARLEKEFNRHKWDTQWQQYRANIATAIDWVFLKPIPDLPSLQKALEKEKISLIIPKDPSSLSQSLFFIDQQTNAVFDSRNLDSPYQLTALQRRCEQSKIALAQKQGQAEEQTHRIRHRL